MLVANPESTWSFHAFFSCAPYLAHCLTSLFGFWLRRVIWD